MAIGLRKRPRKVGKLLMYWQVKVNGYPPVGKYAFPKTKTWYFQSKQEADAFFEAKTYAYKQNKQGYGRLSVLLRKLNQEGKETERTRFLIIK